MASTEEALLEAKAEEAAARAALANCEIALAVAQELVDTRDDELKVALDAAANDETKAAFTACEKAHLAKTIAARAVERTIEQQAELMLAQRAAGRRVDEAKLAHAGTRYGLPGLSYAAKGLLEERRKHLDAIRKIDAQVVAMAANFGDVPHDVRELAGRLGSAFESANTITLGPLLDCGVVLSNNIVRAHHASDEGVREKAYRPYIGGILDRITTEVASTYLNGRWEKKTPQNRRSEVELAVSKAVMSDRERQLVLRELERRVEAEKYDEQHGLRIADKNGVCLRRATPAEEEAFKARPRVATIDKRSGPTVNPEVFYKRPYP